MISSDSNELLNYFGLPLDIFDSDDENSLNPRKVETLIDHSKLSSSLPTSNKLPNEVD